MVMKEKDEELLLFLEMRRREKEKKNDNLLLDSSDDPLGTCSISVLMFWIFKLEQISWKFEILSDRNPFYVQW